MTRVEIKVLARVEPDQDADLSYLGELTDTWEPGVIQRENWERGEYRYFKPAYSVEEHVEHNVAQGKTCAEAVKIAHQTIRDHYERFEACGDDWVPIGLIVELYVDGHDISGASLWGIESDSDETYFEEVIGDLLLETGAYLHKLDWIKPAVLSACVKILTSEEARSALEFVYEEGYGQPLTYTETVEILFDRYVIPAEEDDNDSDEDN